MAEQQPPQPSQQGQQGVPSSHLMDLLGILGAGGVAGTFLTPNQFRRLTFINRQPQGVHPAVWKYLSENKKGLLGGSPETQVAKDYQRYIDDNMLANLKSFKNYPASDPDLFKRSGWSISPITGEPVREVPDTGFNLIPGKRNTSHLYHPTIDFGSLYGIDKIHINKGFTRQQGLYDPDSNKITLGSNSPESALHELTHVGQEEAGVTHNLDPLEYGSMPGPHWWYTDPRNWKPEDFKNVTDIFRLRETPIGSADDLKSKLMEAARSNDMNTLKHWSTNLTYFKDPTEIQATNVENRFLNPSLYTKNPHDTQLYPNTDILRILNKP